MKNMTKTEKWLNYVILPFVFIVLPIVGWFIHKWWWDYRVENW